MEDQHSSGIRVPKLIGISGKEGSGKDTCAAMLIKMRAFSGYDRLAFAWPVKQIVSIITRTSMDFQLSREGKNSSVDFSKIVEGDTFYPTQIAFAIGRDVFGWNYMDTCQSEQARHIQWMTRHTKNLIQGSPTSHGNLQQRVGTDYKQEFGQNVWVRLGLDHAKTHHKIGTIITDVRFHVEVDEIISRGGVVLRMEGDPAGARLSSTRDPNHISETELDGSDKFAHVIDNHVAEFDALRQRLEKIFPDA